MNLFWWRNREHGLGGITSPIIPFGDVRVMGFWGQTETGLYIRGLTSQSWGLSLDCDWCPVQNCVVAILLRSPTHKIR
jgi:hypothetical protein